MNDAIKKEISISDIEKLNEDSLMFITTPGRMGDEYGSTFVVKEDELNYSIYRMEDASKYWNTISSKFSKWNDERVNFRYNATSKEDEYIYVEMGFGNSLWVNKKIYNDFYKFLFEEVKKHELYNENDKEDYNYCINFQAWFPAMINMFNSMGVNVKKVLFDNL